MERKVVLVTGANRGIGLEVVKQFLQKNMITILTSRGVNEGMEIVEEINHPNLYYHQLDVTDQESITNAAAYVHKKFQVLDILINNAGINYDVWHSAVEANLGEVRQTLETNLFGPWMVAKTFIPLMKKSHSAAIVNVSSGAGSLNDMSGGTPGYSISKASLNVLTIKLAEELKPDGILVNSVCPGWVRTDMGGSNAERSVEEGAKTIVWAGLISDDHLTGKFFRDQNEIAW